MNPLLQKALEKLGLKSFNDLNDIERETFKKWESALNQGEITSTEVIDAIKLLLDSSLDKIEEAGLPERDVNLLLATIKVARHFLRVVDSPQEAVKAVEREINSL